MDYLTETMRSRIHVFDLAARNVDRAILQDVSAPSTVEVMNVNAQSGPTVSGLIDSDYPNLTGLGATLSKVCHVKTLNKVPLPPEILERFNHIQCHSMMGLFTEIRRAWLTIDSDVYIWTYEEGGDVAYYDGLNETIVCLGLIEPKSGIFHTFIKHLLIICTALDIVVLGVTFTENATTGIEEIQLVPEPVFTIPTDGATITTVCGTAGGRLFLGAKDGSLFEIYYQAQSNWFGKRCKKINHSTSALSFLMPSFLNAALSDEDGIIQMVVDDSRHILYTLTEKSAISVYDLGERGDAFTKIATLSQSALVQQAMSAVKKSLDSQNFRPIVSLAAVCASESALINVVAVAQTGVRFYLSVVGLTNLVPNQRPYCLTLLHVRLPPGYSATVTVRPRNVHMAHYREGNLMVLSTVNDKDTLWCLNSDLFLFSPIFVESYTTCELDGPAWVLSEERYNHQVKDTLQPLPPLAVRQHGEPPRKFIALTAQGVHIFLKLRPVDILRQLLIDCRGPDHNAVKVFFTMQREEQACASALILACLESVQNAEVAEWATRAFFMYGGEARVAVNAPSFHQQSAYADSSVFSPNVISTPMPSHFQRATSFQQQPPPPTDQSFGGYTTFVHSAKHNSLYLYLSRILRPIWNSCCVEKVEADKKIYYVSSLSADECSFTLQYLNALRNFLAKNTQLGACNANVSAPNLNQTLQDAQIEERQSLDCLKKFVSHCCQIMGMWKILCDHQFHKLVEVLPDTYQQMLPTTTFKEIALYGQDLCSAFINCLINSYLADNASVDAISNKLREICPELYKTEDAACSKAYEILQLAKTLHNADEREEHVVEALNLCKSIASQINLHEVCQQFASLEAYYAVIDLCFVCAKQIDPDNIAEYYYKEEHNGTAAAQQDIHAYYMNKMKIYKEIVLILNNLHTQVSIAYGSPRPLDAHNRPLAADKEEQIMQIIRSSLKHNDTLLHVAIYEWMIAKKMESELIRLPYTTLEDYLIYASKRNPNDITTLDLLWKYYECNSNHASAAQILCNLAGKVSNKITLVERVEYLTRAIMCMRSDKLGYAPNLGVFLKDIEDKLEMARIQELIMRALENLPDNYPNVTEAIAKINNELFDLTQLYEDFADPFKLWECKLSIIDCADYADLTLIKSIWKNIMDEEVARSTLSGSDKLAQVLSKISNLLVRYKSKNSIPLEYIIEELEMISVAERADPAMVSNVVLQVAPMENVIQNYDKLIARSNMDMFWSIEENEFHLCQAYVSLVENFLASARNCDHHLRIRLKAMCEDSIANLLSRLYRKPNTEELINLLRQVQTRLSKIN